MNDIGIRAQAAIEYLSTNALMFLIVAAVIGVLVALYVFNPGIFVSDTCSLTDGFVCLSTVLNSSGVLSLNLQQNTQSIILIKTAGCDTNQSLQYANTVTTSALPSGGNVSLSIQCYSSGSKFSGPIGSVYKGFLIINYTNQMSGLQHTMIGSLLLKVKKT